MAEDFYSKFVTDRNRRKIQKNCIFQIFNCLQIRSKIRFFTAPDAFTKRPKNTKTSIAAEVRNRFQPNSTQSCFPIWYSNGDFFKTTKKYLTPFLIFVSTVPLFNCTQSPLLECNLLKFECNFLARIFVIPFQSWRSAHVADGSFDYLPGNFPSSRFRREL